MEQDEIEATLQSIREALETSRIDDALAALLRLRPPDRAEAFSDLDDDSQAALLPRLDIPATADLLEDLQDEEAAEVAGSLSNQVLADVLDEMEPDEAADVLGDLSPERRAQALADMEDAEEVVPLLGHPDETAGGLMTTAFIQVRRFTTVAQALGFLREVGSEEETPNTLYVVNRDGALIGVVGLRELLLADPQATIESIMERDVISVPVGADQEEAARLMIRYDLTALPVVNEQRRLVGVITHDDVIEVLEEEATEDVLHLGAVESGPLVDKPYWSQRLGEVVRARFFWLLGLFVAETLTGTVLRHFSGELQAVVSLSFFIPLLIGTGGNAGSQTVTTVIRALALKEVHHHDALRVLFRELRTAAILGTLLGAVAFGRVLLWGLPTEMATVVSVTILAICVWANTVGCLVPILAHALGIDPTVMSAPLITTLVDATGLLIYLSVAAMVLSEI
ncbi:MAG TPA: magnesium transporter [Anaerolineales bacterium]|nr:magnesium transporter [Anaerolineales bacterium]